MSAATVAGQTIVVVGAASGIGRAAAKLLGEHGARVACLDQDAAGAEETAGAIGVAGGHALSGRIDVTQPGTIAPALQAVTERWGQLHGLVNCAGITGLTNLRSHEVPPDDFDRVAELVVDVLKNTEPQGESKAKYTLADGTAARVHAAAAELLDANPLYPGLTL